MITETPCIHMLHPILFLSDMYMSITNMNLNFIFIASYKLSVDCPFLPSRTMHVITTITHILTPFFNSSKTEWCICVTEIDHHCFRWWLGEGQVPSHYRNQWGLLVIFTEQISVKFGPKYDNFQSSKTNSKMPSEKGKSCPQCVDTIVSLYNSMTWFIIKSSHKRPHAPKGFWWSLITPYIIMRLHYNFPHINQIIQSQPTIL